MITPNAYHPDRFHGSLLELRSLVPGLRNILKMDPAGSNQAWSNLDARLLPLLDPRMPLMIAICGGANAGKSTLFNSLLGATLSPIRGDAGSTRRVLIAGHPEIFELDTLLAALFEPFGRVPEPLTDSTAALQPGPPLYLAHPRIPREQLLVDTPDFDTGLNDRYVNRRTAREVLEACHILVYMITNATYNNLENSRFMRQMLTAAGMRKCIIIYRCSKTYTDSQALEHISTAARNLYGEDFPNYIIGCYRTDDSDAVAVAEEPMQLRPVRPGDPPFHELLQNLDPRSTRREQIETTLAAFVDYVGKLLSESRTVSRELQLYAGVLKLSLSHGVRQALASVPIETIMQRMNAIWMETSPGYLKFFRGVGHVMGKPARLVLSLVKSLQGEENQQNRRRRKGQALEEMKSNLLGAAADLRDKILAEEMIAETTGADRDGAALIELLDRIRLDKGLQQQELPFRQVNAASGSVTVHVAAPRATLPLREATAQQPWQAAADRMSAAAEQLLDIEEDEGLNRQLTLLVNDFRRQMDFIQKTRESFFASLNLLPATLGLAYIMTTGDPVGGSGIYAKFHGLFGMHDLWALVSIPASAGLDQTGRKNLSEMLSPVISRWLDDRAGLVQGILEDTVSGRIVDDIEKLSEEAEGLISEIEKILTRMV